MPNGVRLLGLWCATAVVVSAQISPLSQADTSELGRPALPYEVVDGWAVHAGDMVLGTAEEAVKAAGRRSAKLANSEWPGRRNISASYATTLWPQGMVPYVIDTDFSAETREDILVAIEAWNTKTIISLFPRTSEADYVRFSTTTERCRSHVGMVGGEQSIWWVRAGDDCGGVSFLIHEIGHTVGLWHEHQRTDRDTYLTVREEAIFQTGMQWIVANDHPAEGPYDFASVMHYHPIAHSRDGLPVLETIPPGIEIRTADGGLSAGDIHGVASLYGRRPWPTTITTNPPGLEIVINGQQVTTPATRYWTHGSIKTLAAPTPQTRDGSRYLFGRWNDEGDREHNVTVGDGGTWLEANFIVQHSISASPYPASAGTVTIDPPSPDGYYTLRTGLNIRPTPTAGSEYKFWRWGLWRTHGLSSNPASILADKPDQFAAHFTTDALFRIDSTVGPFLLYIDDNHSVGPVALHPTDYVEPVRVTVPAVQVRPISSYRPSRYRFEGWMDGGPLARDVDVSEGGELVARFRTEYYLDSAVTEPSSGSVTVDPPAPAGDGYYPGGSSVRLAAVPNQGWDFVHWLGDSKSGDRMATVEMDRARSVEAVFKHARGKAPNMARAVAPPPTDYSIVVPGGEQRFRVVPPPGATEIAIRFKPSMPGADVKLLAFARQEPASRAFVPDGSTPVFDPDFRSADSEAGETLVISANSTPALDPAQTYYFSVVPTKSSPRIAGTVQVEIAALPLAGRVRPRALTFVAPTTADAPPQSLTLANPESGIMRYRFDERTPWLRAEPREGVLQPHESAEIAIQTHSAGIAPDTYHRELTVHLTDEAGQPIGNRVVQVAFAVVPPPDSSLR